MDETERHWPRAANTDRFQQPQRDLRPASRIGLPSGRLCELTLNYLFSHPNFPGQYRHIVRKLARDSNNRVVFICDKKDRSIPGVRKVEINYVPINGIAIHKYIASFERSLYKAEVVRDLCLRLRSEGFTPDVMCAHPGWGESLFLKDAFPDTPLLNYCEFFYRPVGADIGFDPDDAVAPDTSARLRIRNVNGLINLNVCDKGIAPTEWQRSVHPEEYHSKITVLHEGIDTDFLIPGVPCVLDLPGGTRLVPGDEVVTYIARNLEPYRGFRSFMRAVELLLKERPKCHVLVVGGEGSSYSRNPSSMDRTKQKYLKSLRSIVNKCTSWEFCPTTRW